MDRTNWIFGRTDITVLPIFMCYASLAHRALWRALPKASEVNTAGRKALIEHFSQLLPAEKLCPFLADREFIEKDWFCLRRGTGASIYMRVKKNITVEVGDGTLGQLFWLLEVLPVIGSASGKTKTHGTLHSLRKECRVFGREGLHLVERCRWTTFSSRQTVIRTRLSIDTGGAGSSRHSLRPCPPPILT
jgi:hypothetical protein